MTQIKEVTIAISGQEYLQDQREKDKAIDLLSQSTSLALENSIKYENCKQENIRLNARLETSNRFLSKFLEEFESEWDNDEQCASPEIADDYIRAAKWMADYFGRRHNRIDAVTAWYHSQDSLPFNRTCRVSKQYPVNP